MVIKDILKERNLPQFKSREEMLDILMREEYGYIPPKPEKINFRVTNEYIPNFCAGKATVQKVDIISAVRIGSGL